MANSRNDGSFLVNNSNTVANESSKTLEPAVLQGKEVIYPITLPIKVAGFNKPTLFDVISDICQEFEQVVTKDMMKQRTSSNGKYLSVTFDFEASSRERLNDFYRRLESHEMIKWTL
jgi:putative lipoic acid-binding regulatory protein